MDDSSQINKELANLTKELGVVYTEAKKWDNQKTEYRKKFFELADKFQGALAEKVVLVAADSLANAIIEAEKLYPGWISLSATQVENGFDVHLKENVKYKPFSYVNPDDNMIYQKQVVAGPVLLDDEKFKKDHPKLYEIVTYMPEPKRELRPLDELSGEQIAILQDYIYEGKPVIKLAAPRKIKENEL
jgi:hypothetical protein